MAPVPTLALGADKTKYKYVDNNNPPQAVHSYPKYTNVKFGQPAAEFDPQVSPHP